MLGSLSLSNVGELQLLRDKLRAHCCSAAYGTCVGGTTDAGYGIETGTSTFNGDSALAFQIHGGISQAWRRVFSSRATTAAGSPAGLRSGQSLQLTKGVVLSSFVPSYYLIAWPLVSTGASLDCAAPNMSACCASVCAADDLSGMCDEQCPGPIRFDDSHQARQRVLNHVHELRCWCNRP